MKKTVLTFVLLLPVCSIAWAGGHYGALAIDKSKGFIFGWSNDYQSPDAAEARALRECNDRGGNCTVVMNIQGEQSCGAYRTLNNNEGTAYGWGKAATKEEADRIATGECAKRANGMYCANYVWSCNSADDSQDEAKKSAAPALDMYAVAEAIRDFYDNSGEWAGQFRIDSIQKIRIEGTGDVVTAHVMYHYVPQPGNPNGAGYDQRTFGLNLSGGRVRVTSMGEHMSAEF